MLFLFIRQTSLNLLFTFIYVLKYFLNIYLFYSNAIRFMNYCNVYKVLTIFLVIFTFVISTKGFC